MRRIAACVTTCIGLAFMSVGNKANCYDNKDRDHGPTDYWPDAPHPS